MSWFKAKRAPGSKEVKGSFSIGFALAGVSWFSGYGAIGSILIGVLSLIGQTIGFHFNHMRLFLGAITGAGFALAIRFILRRSIAQAFEEGAGFGTARKAVEMVWDPVSKSFVMKR